MWSRYRVVVICCLIITICIVTAACLYQATITTSHATQAKIFRVYRLDQRRWMPYREDVVASDRVLVVTPGVLEPLESGFPPDVAEKIGERGHYDVVLGVAYDWSLPVSRIAPYYAAFLTHLPAGHLDLEGHSYGAIQTIAALNRTRVVPQNVIFLGSPLAGTPLATRTYLTRVLLRLPGQVWDGNVGRFSQMQANGAAADLLPGSALLQSLMKPFAQRVADRHINVILVAGSESPHVAALANLYMRLFAIECWSCSIDNDGVIPVSSAFGIDTGVSLAAKAHAKAFRVLHADMERDPEIIDFVARHLAR